jgi:hypothetical protein
VLLGLHYTKFEIEAPILELQEQHRQGLAAGITVLLRTAKVSHY